MRFLNLVAIFTPEALEVDRVHIQVISFEFFILLIMVDNIGDDLLLIEASLVD